MIDFLDINIFKNNISTLKDCSIDDHDGKKTYLTLSNLAAVNFDKVKDQYVADLSLSEIPKSNDSLFIDAIGTPTFIEFKGGYIDKNKAFSLRGKIFDSMLIFTDIINKGISYTRQNMNYILVYIQIKNENPIDKKEYIQTSKSRDELNRILAKPTKKRFICFGLARFQNYCFKNVFTYTKEEFEENFVKVNMP